MLGFLGFVEHQNGIIAIAKVSHLQTLAEGNEKAKRVILVFMNGSIGPCFLKDNESALEDA